MSIKNNILTVILLTSLGACNTTPADNSGDKLENPDRSSIPSTSASASASSRSTEGDAVAIANDDLEFKYSWPAAAASQPSLVSYLTQEREKTLAELKAQTTTAKNEAKKNGFPYRVYAESMEWKRVADIPGFLSLSGEWYNYTGGAHGMSGVNSLIWDKTAQKPLDGIKLFTDKSAFDEAAQSAFCNKLDKERSKRRGVTVVRNQDDGFTECINPSEQTVLLGSSNGKTFDRLTIYAGPYAAGPYVEGAYEINLPVTAAILAAVKPSYKESFSTGK